jgi:beta-glucosidase-like glycosyl hydrolase
LQRRAKQSLEVVIMKSLIKAVALAVVLAAPVATFAQSNQPVTRAQVRAELVQLEKAGYNPSQNDDATYPVQIQAAEARVAAENASASGVGGVVSGSLASGAPAAVIAPTTRSIYAGH